MFAILRVRRIILAVAAAVLLTAPASARADDTYAAIAFSPTTGKYGIGNEGTREKAEKNAVDDCKGDNAQVVVWVKNGFCCLAVGADNKYGVGSDKDEATAYDAAITECRKKTTYTKEAGGFNVGTHCVPVGDTNGSIQNAPPDGQAAPPPPIADEIIRKMNAERKNAGVPELTVSPALMAVEAKYAKFMAQKDMLDHNLDGAMGDRFTRDGYKHLGAGECAASGQADAAAVIKSLMDDKPHHDIMVSPDYTEIGVGVAANADGKLYYVLGFGKPQ